MAKALFLFTATVNHHKTYSLSSEGTSFQVIVFYKVGNSQLPSKVNVQPAISNPKTPLDSQQGSLCFMPLFGKVSPVWKA